MNDQVKNEKTLVELKAEEAKLVSAVQSAVANGSDFTEDNNKLKLVRKEIADINAKVDAKKTELKNTITKFDFKVEDIFTPDELKNAGYTKKVKAKGSKPKTDKGIEFIKIAGSGVGNPGYSYKIGKIFKPVSDTNKKPFQKFPEKLLAVATSFEELSKHVAENEDAKKHFNTEAGKNEIRAIVEYVKNQNLKASELAAKFGPK